MFKKIFGGGDAAVNETSALLGPNKDQDDENSSEHKCNGERSSLNHNADIYSHTNSNNRHVSLNNDNSDSHERISSSNIFLRSSARRRKSKNDTVLSLWTIGCILSTSFSYGCIMTTLFLITLPVECERIETQHPTIPKSVALGCFVAIAGVTQLISPLVGMLSDTYRPPLSFQLGQRMPYLSLGAICSVIGLMGEYIESYQKLWLRYGFFFFLHMIGLNVMYSMMIAFIPDQVPHRQTGVANGILAFELVTGSLFGFGLFHFYFGGHIQDMYGLYICIVVITTILTGMYAHDGDASRMEVIYSFRPFHDDLTRGQRRRRQIILGPFVLLKTLTYDPIRKMDCQRLCSAYTIDIQRHHDFFIVTLSRLCYYCGSSVQTFFLYFLHDIIGVTENPESAVAGLAVVSQISGALFCYPVGYISDTFCRGRRKPFVYIACTFLGSITFAMIFARTMNQMVILCFLLGAANGSYLTMETSLAVDTLPEDYEEAAKIIFSDEDDDGDDEEEEEEAHENGVRRAEHRGRSSSGGGNAQLLGVWGVAAFLGSALGPMIGGPLLYVFGSVIPNNTDDDEEQQEPGNLPEYTIHGYAVVLSLSTMYFLLSALTLRWVRKPDV